MRRESGLTIFCGAGTISVEMLYESPPFDVGLQYGIATLRFRPASRWSALAYHLDLALGQLAEHPGIDVLVLRDFALLPRHAVTAEATSSEHAWRLSRLGQRIADALERLPFPSVAHFDGPCPGPALELALACTWRTSSGQIGTRFGTRDVSCWGGAARLPRLVGRDAALALLSGTAVFTGERAYSLGIIDRVWPPRMAEVHLLALELALQERPSAPSRLARRLRRARSARVEPPVQVANWLIRAVNRGGRFGPAEALAVERAAARAAVELRLRQARPLRVAA